MAATPAQLLRTPLGNAAKQARSEGRDPETDPLVIECRRALAEAKLEARIREIVDGWPPLSQDQRDRLAIILRGDAA